MNAIPYSKLALIYDKVMSHVNYKMWAQYINTLFQFSDIKVNTVLDVACGTGKHIKFLKKKKTVVGADLSYPMLKGARQNNSGDNVFVVNDARKSAFLSSSFDAILMLYDSINYMMIENDVTVLFEEMYRILKPGGIFIFDFVTEQGLKECYDDYFESDNWDGLAYERHGWYSKKEKIQHNEFLFLFNGESHKELHIQYIHDIYIWRKLVRKSKMQLCHEFSNFSLLPPDKYSERIHFICKRDF